MFVSVTKDYSKMIYPRSRPEQMPMKRMRTMRTMATQRNRLTPFARRPRTSWESSCWRAARIISAKGRFRAVGKGPQQRKLEARKLTVDDLEAEEELRR